MNKPVTIIDYSAGNLKSIVNMLKFLNVDCEITSDIKKIENAQRIIFPGQGHFAQAMELLHDKKLVEPIKAVIEAGTPFLGICLGLQILFEESEEAPDVKGLGILKGKVKKFRHGKIPQIGWNRVFFNEELGIRNEEWSEKNSSFLIPNSSLIKKNDYFYFVNSYYVVPENEGIILAKTNYHIDFCSAIEHKNLCAVQFHPEKSSESGLGFFKRWLNIS